MNVKGKETDIVMLSVNSAKFLMVSKDSWILEALLQETGEFIFSLVDDH